VRLLPGLSFSWRRAVGLSGLKAHAARRLGIPLTRGGLERRIGRAVLRLLTGRKRRNP